MSKSKFFISNFAKGANFPSAIAKNIPEYLLPAFYCKLLKCCTIFRHTFDLSHCFLKIKFINFEDP